MAETNGSLVLQQKIHHPNPALQSLLHSLDPISLLLSQNSKEQPVQFRLTTESFIMQRGPRYRAYAELRESKLRMKNSGPHEQEEEELKLTLTPPLKKQVKFQSNLEIKRKPSSTSLYSSSVVAQSVPDFSSVLRKENRKPPTTMTTPPAKSLSKSKSLSNSRGSKSANAGENKRSLVMARKSYASLEELKGFSLAAANAINGGDNKRGGGRRVLGYRAI
ncbi:hypothetical protein L484_027049 [Morus notabilis]|uniref:Uncharacterized protein n=1 Tax=Morus notabilis TaxID=981085 RepID=W9S8V9_9ROSA|nr:uncharacterized protein LOC21409677 [Morus notabilis]EXC20496.1 hypothetical protein L484_027049 [Morus notabilis]